MGVARDIVESYSAPRRVFRRLLAMGRREDRALAFLMLACVLIFVSEWPMLAEAARDAPETPVEMRLGGALLAWLGLMPLVLYGVAGVAHLAARVLGGSGTFYTARLALFWALLAASPLWLLYGLVTALAGAGLVQTLVGAIAFGGFLWLWSLTMIEGEAGGEHAVG